MPLNDDTRRSTIPAGSRYGCRGSERARRTLAGSPKGESRVASVGDPHVTRPSSDPGARSCSAFSCPDCGPGDPFVPRPQPAHKQESHKWTPKANDLIVWFHENRDRLPQSSFQVRQGVVITSPGRFFSSLDNDIEAGPSHPRNVGLVADLEDLRRLCDAGESQNAAPIEGTTA